MATRQRPFFNKASVVLYLFTCHRACLESIKHFDLIRGQYNPRWNANQPFVRAVHKDKLDPVISHLSGLELPECVDQSALIHLLISSRVFEGRHGT